MKNNLEELLKQLKDVKRPVQNKESTKQKLLTRIQSNQKRQTLQYRSVLVVATVLAFFLGALFWMQGDSKWQQQASQPTEANKVIQSIYKSKNSDSQYFMARDSIFYPGNRKIAKSDKEMYAFMDWLLKNIKPIEQGRTVYLDGSDVDIVVRYDDGQLRNFKLGELYDTYEEVLVDWDTKQYYTLPTLTEKQRIQLQKLTYNQSFYFPIFIIILSITTSIVEKKIRKKYTEPTRIKVYNSWIGNSISMLIGILILSPAFLSIFLHMHIHLIVPLLLYITYVIGDWLWFRKGGRTAAQQALMYWNYIYILIICLILYFFA